MPLNKASEQALFLKSVISTADRHYAFSVALCIEKRSRTTLGIPWKEILARNYSGVVLSLQLPCLLFFFFSSLFGDWTWLLCT